MSGALLRHQADISGPVPMPVDRVDDTSVVNTASAETVVWYYDSSGAWATAATQAAGTICMAKLTYTGVTNSIGSAIGSYNDTSLSFAAATRAETKVTCPEDILSRMQFMSPTDQIATITPYLGTAGYYVIDHRRSQIWLKSKAQVANDSATYKYFTVLSGGSAGDKADIIKIGGATLAIDDAAFTPGTSGMMTIGGFADETSPDSVTEGDVGALRMTLDRRLVGAGETTDDAAAETGTRVVCIGARADETSTDSVDEGDHGWLRMTLNRRLIVAGMTLDDAAFGVGTEYVQAIGYLADETSSDSVDEGDIGLPRMTLDRRVIGAGHILDDAAFGVATSYVTPIAGLADETSSDSVDEGDTGVLRMTLDRRLIIASQILDDAAFGIGTSYVNVLGALVDDTATDSVDEGDVGAPRMSADRILYAQGAIAHDAADSGNPIKIGFKAVDPASMPADVTAADRVNGVADLKGRQIVYMGTALDIVNDAVGAVAKASATITGTDTLWDSDGDNTAQALKVSAGNLYKVHIVNGGATLNAVVSYVQLFDLATTSVTVGTTAPKFVLFVPASGAVVIDLSTPMTFATAMTYACTTAPTTNGDPTNGLSCSFGYK